MTIINSNRVLIWEVAGILFVIIVGSFLHFLYELLELPLVGIISPVNESLFEHLKLGFWSIVFFSLIQYIFLNDQVNNFLVAKAVAILILQSFIMLFFFSYTAITEEPIVFLDIMSYIFGTVLAYSVSYKTLISSELREFYSLMAGSFIIIHGTLLAYFTYNRPDHWFFHPLIELMIHFII
ncbi:DUF6512 family protein [Natranaerobius thermophilus]|uniref:Uncharacterized protein n=1 Tax=Natranaerobius thermophilus (strain ATCC BAA-1301 / DSM 18059 / JW/NM-WN-LF) TaxID=457570 RepID=B2A630_NATTJ|nr:DUF6512 family protein [Natranaerobius thermophilus]ACB85447.1 conserved hypothetical protein [Natranaerobius thermophilus JW/NM-WN-LF]